MVVAAFDNEAEFEACLEGVQAEIGWRKDRGEAVDPREHASGVVYEPGYLRRAANGHLLRRAVEHGVAGTWIDELDLPSNMSVVRARHPAAQRSWLSAAWRNVGARVARMRGAKFAAKPGKTR